MIPAGATIGGYHTYNDFRMIPKHKLIVPEPEPELFIVDVPGVDGSIDLTSKLTGQTNPEPAKDDFEGSWDFRIVLSDDYIRDYTNCLSLFNGTVKQCIFDDFPGKVYRGRFWIADWHSYEGYSDCTIGFHIYNELGVGG